MAINIDQQINYAIKDLPNNNYLLGKGSMQPFSPANSGSRKLMHNIHLDHLIIPDNAEIPIVGTGYENEFGRKSSSYVTSDADFVVLAKIKKFSFIDNVYYLIIQNKETGVYDVIERTTAKHNTESFGYLYNNKYLDSLQVGSQINKGDVIKKSNGFDEYGNKMNGVNLTTLYLSCAQNMEDSIIISESAAKKMSASFIHNTNITINDNDILLNLYGNDNLYKTFPDIGEEIKNHIFCSIRRMENDNILYSLSQQRLKDIMISDKNILIDGTVVDINVYCNNPELLSESHYNQQLYFYYKENLEFSRQINDFVGPLAMNGKMTYELEKLYARCRDTVAGKKFFNDKVFNNVVLEITTIKSEVLQEGDKMSDRYGGKGVISEVRPDHLMPRLDNGEIVEVIKNQSTCINRENVGQLHEQSLTFMGSRFIDYFKMGVLSYTERAQLLYEFLYELEPEYAKFALSAVDFYDEFESKLFVDSIIEDGRINLSLEPFTSGITLDKLNSLYKKFPWIKPYKVSIPMEDSNGNIRYIETRRPLIVGKIYNYRLKQFAEEKFSATSLSATNIKNLNTRSRASKMYESRFTKTPIMFGPMETGNMSHLSMQYVIMNLMLYSSSPQARRLFENLLIGDPYDIDIKLDSESKNRNAEIINTYFKTMGLRLVFDKIPKQKKQMCTKIMIKPIANKDFSYKTNIREIIGEDDIYKFRAGNAKIDKSGKRMISKVMIKKVDDKNDK